MSLIIAPNGTTVSPPIPSDFTILKTVVDDTVGASYTVDATVASVFNLTLNSNTTISFTNLTGRVVTVNIIQDGVGSRLVTWVGVTWGVTGVPVLRTGAGERDKLVFENNSITTDGHLIEPYEA